MLERCAGLVFGFLFRGPEAVRVRDETLGRHLAQGYSWLWLHLALSDHRARRFVEGFDDIPADARSLILSQEDRIQLILTASGAWGILPDIERDFDDQSLESCRMGFWLDGERLITARRHPLRAAENLRDAVEKGDVPAGPAQALVRQQEHFFDLVEHRLGMLGRDLGRIEDEVLADRDHIGREVLGPLRRELSRYAREFSALRGAIYRATTARGATLSSPLTELLPALHQQAEDLERDAAALSDRARLIYEEIGSRVADNTSRSLSALTVISTLLLPPTFLVGAFGMNVGGIPWAQSAHGFWYGVGLCAALVFTGYLVLRRFRILP
ncbi:MAG TPA: CorA family divalent cation transporter [Rhizomicrobium sp.]|nr:CorA family divalent cation transporter [Rhizomicrobium sp.]